MNPQLQTRNKHASQAAPHTRSSRFGRAAGLRAPARLPAQPNAPNRAAFSLGALSPGHCTAATILAQRQTTRAGTTEERHRPSGRRGSRDGRNTKTQSPVDRCHRLHLVRVADRAAAPEPRRHTHSRMHAHTTQCAPGGEKVKRCFSLRELRPRKKNAPLCELAITRAGATTVTCCGH